MLSPSLSILDGNNGDGNEHFFWLKPIGKSVESGKFAGEPNPDLFPTVVVCERVDQGGGVFDSDDTAPPLASWEPGPGAKLHGDLAGSIPSVRSPLPPPPLR